MTAERCTHCGGTILPRARSGAARGTCACQPRSPLLARGTADPGGKPGGAEDEPRSQPQAGAGEGDMPAAATPPERQGGTLPSGWVPLHATPVRLDTVAPDAIVMAGSGRVFRKMAPQFGQRMYLEPLGGGRRPEVVPPDTLVQVCTNVFPSRNAISELRTQEE